MNWKTAIGLLAVAFFLAYLLLAPQPIIIGQVHVPASFAASGYSSAVMREAILFKIQEVTDSIERPDKKTLVSAPREVPEFDVPGVGLSFNLFLVAGQKLLQREPLEVHTYVTTSQPSFTSQPEAGQFQLVVSVVQGDDAKRAAPVAINAVNPEELIRAIAMAILSEIDPVLVAAHYYFNEMEEDALQVLGKAITTNRDSAAALRLRAQIFFQQGKEVEAYQDLDTVPGNNPTDVAKARMLEGLFLYGSRKFPEADAKFAEALAASPGDAASIYAFWGNALLGGGDAVGAAAKLMIAVHEPLAKAQDWLDLAKAETLIGKFADAELTARRAVELDPALEEGKYVLSFIYTNWSANFVAQKHYDEAVGVLEKIPDDDERDSSLRNLYARWIAELVEEKRCGDALPLFPKLTKLDPDNPETFEHWGNCLKERNEPGFVEKLARATELRDELQASRGDPITATADGEYGEAAAPETPPRAYGEAEAPEAYPQFPEVFFDAGVEFLVSGSESLDVIAKWLLENPETRVEVEGHTDDTISAEEGLGLGAARAKTVVEELIRRGVPEKQMSTVSYGNELPVCIESTPLCHAKNNRVHIVPLDGNL